MVFIFWSPIPKKERESTPEISIFFFRITPIHIKKPQIPQIRIRAVSILKKTVS